MLFNKIIAVHIDNHTKAMSTKYSFTDCYESWNIYLPESFKNNTVFLTAAKISDLTTTPNFYA
jgi:hypothetical protein